MRLPGFIGSSYTLQSRKVDVQRLQNMFAEVNEMGTGKDGEVASLVPTPGLRLWKTVGTGPIRGLFNASNGRSFIVSGSEVYEAQGEFDAPVKRGDLITASGKVSIADNGQQMMIVDGPKGYIFTFADDSFVQITDDAFTGGTRVAFIDGYFVTNEPNTQKFWISALYDGLSWNGLDFGAAEGLPDNILSLIADHRELVLIGDRSAEFWYNSGDASFPFARMQGAFLEYGIEAPDSLQKLDNSIVWLGRDADGHRMVWKANGYQAQRISTHAVETALQSYGDVSRASAWTYQMGGHSFYVLNFEGANTTWCYDAATSLWHERTYTNAQGKQERHRADCHVFVGSKHYVGDYASGNIYELTTSCATDNGAPKKWLRTTTHTSNDGKRLFCAALEINAEVASSVFDDLGQTSDPKVMLRWSDDGGHVWSDEREMSAGKIGEYLRRMKESRLGSFRDRVWEVSGTYPMTLISASVELEGGQS